MFLKVEQFFQKPATFFAFVSFILRGDLCGRCLPDRAVNNLVKLATVKPNTPTRRTIVYLDATAVRDDKGGSVDRTFHLLRAALWLGSVMVFFWNNSPPNMRIW
jgi:hypothetical protein